MNIRRDGPDRRLKRILFPILLAVIILILFFAVLYFFLIFNSGGAGDWVYNDLPGKYEIWRMNSSHIELIYSKGDDGGSRVIKGYITSFCFNDSFIGIQQIAIDDKAHEIPKDSTINFYLVNVKEEQVLGPFTEEEYIQLCDRMDIRLYEWIATVPAPEGAVFP